MIRSFRQFLQRRCLPAAERDGKMTTARRASRLAIFALAAGAAIFIAGCSSRPTLTVSSDRKLTFTQSFTQAYATRSVDGDYDIVLVDDPIDDAEVSPPGKPLESRPVRPLKHMVHIHVMWAPMIGDRGDHPSATNAAINWYVWGDSSGDHVDMMHYGGAGFVKIYAGDTSADFMITNTTLKLKASRGLMTDPVGTAQLSGSFSAPLNETRVKELLAQLGEDAGSPKMTRLDLDSPPSRIAEP